MLTVRAAVTQRQQLVMIGRVVLGAWMLLFAANALFLHLWAAPTGTEPLAAQLMTSLSNSRLLHVALSVQLIAGALLLIGALVPLALTAQLCVTTCALFWALFLDRSAVGAIVTLAAFALNGLLMLAYLPYYKQILARRSVAAGETAGPGNYDALFVNNVGTTARTDFVPAVVVLLVTLVFYGYLVGGRTGDFCILVLMYPLFTVLIRRFRDMGQHPWLLSAPLLLVLLHFDVKLGYLDLGEMGTAATMWIALVVTAAFVAWGAAGGGRRSAPVAA
jgi:hypothetical protein